MALPLPRVVPDVGPGGPLVTSMGGINALHNAMIEKRMNQIKAQYLPLATQAEMASKLAYANLMGPQFLSKLLGNEGALANMSEDQKKNILGLVSRAGVNTSGNPLAQMPQHTGVGQPSTNNFAGYLKNAFKGLVGQQPNQENNPFSDAAQFMPQQQMPQQVPQQLMQGIPQQSEPPVVLGQVKRPKDGVSLEGEQWYNAKGEPVYAEEEQINEPNKKGMELYLDTGRKANPEPSWAENTGKFKGTIKQLEEEGKYRAAALKQIGESQLGLSHSGAVLDRMTGIIKNPVFWNMRNRIPAFQNKQLDYLKAMGTPEEKELIGDFLSTGESFIASTVQGFSGKPLVREFDLAQRQKITPHDTVESAMGKLRSARSLHDIAEQKNQIVSELLDKGYNEADAVKQANKMVDVRAIEKATNELLQRKIEIKNSKTGEKKMVTVEEARKLGVPNV